MLAGRPSLALPLFCAALGLGAGTCAVAPDPARSAGEALSLATLGLQIFLGLGAVALATLSPQPLRVRLGLGRGRLSGRLLVLAVLGTLALSHALDSLLSLTGLREDSALALIDEALGGARGRTLALAVLCLGIAPGVAEELLCRGWLQRALCERLGAGAGIALAAAAFGALHLELAQGAAAAVLGLYLGAVAYIAGSTRAPILCHAANNLAAVLLVTWLGGGAPGSSEGCWLLPSPAVVAALGLGASGAVLWLLWRRRPAPSRTAAASPIGLQGPPGLDDG